MKFIDILGKGLYRELQGKENILHKYYTFDLFGLSKLLPFVSSSIPPLVPTVDTTRTSWMLEQMVKIKRPVVLVGESGTSKTATTQSFLKKVDADTTVSLLSNHVLYVQTSY